MQPSARVYKIIAITSIVVLCVAQSTFAEVNVKISGNVEGSHTSVDVQSSTNSTIHNSTSTNVNTTVHVSANGESKTVTSNTPGNVSVESSNGNVKVNVNNNVNPSPTIIHNETHINTSVHVATTGSNSAVVHITSNPNPPKPPTFDLKKFLQSRFLHIRIFLHNLFPNVRISILNIQDDTSENRS